MPQNQVCRQSGTITKPWRDGLFETAYCVCGAKITIPETYPRTGQDNKYVFMPDHLDSHTKIQFTEILRLTQ